MAWLFFDSSALAKRYAQEQGSSRVQSLIENADSVIVSALAFVEVTSAAVRRKRSGDLTDNQFESLFETLEDEFRWHFRVIELSRDVLTNAAELIQSHVLRAGDGIQLACARIAASETDRDQFTFVSSDKALNAAAVAEGIRVLDPTAEAH